MPYLTGDLHVDRISIITLCLQETFYLSDSNPYKIPTVSGASLFKQLHKATKTLRDLTIKMHAQVRNFTELQK